MNDYPPVVNPSETPAVGVPTFGDTEWPAYTGDHISLPLLIGLLLIVAGIVTIVIRTIQPQSRVDDDPSML